MYDSDSDLEIVESLRPSAAAVARPALLNPTSTSAAEPKHEPRTQPPTASTSSSRTSAGAWATSSRDKQSGSGTSAPRVDSALNSKKLNSLGGNGSNAGAAGERKDTSGVQKAQSGVDTKGKGRADVIVLSSGGDDDDDDDEPLVVVRTRS